MKKYVAVYRTNIFPNAKCHEKHKNFQQGNGKCLACYFENCEQCDDAEYDIMSAVNLGELTESDVLSLQQFIEQHRDFDNALYKIIPVSVFSGRREHLAYAIESQKHYGTWFENLGDDIRNRDTDQVFSCLGLLETKAQKRREMNRMFGPVDSMDEPIPKDKAPIQSEPVPYKRGRKQNGRTAWLLQQYDKGIKSPATLRDKWEALPESERKKIDPKNLSFNDGDDEWKKRACDTIGATIRRHQYRHN
ncbi:MAG: hypothetical protein ACRCUY_11155 [Thermoguttaceae bacterium]